MALLQKSEPNMRNAVRLATHYSTKRYTWSDNKVRELIAVKVLHTSLLNTTVVAFKLPYFSIDNAHLMYNAHPKLFRHSF